MPSAEHMPLIVREAIPLFALKTKIVLYDGFVIGRI